MNHEATASSPAPRAPSAVRVPRVLLPALWFVAAPALVALFATRALPAVADHPGLPATGRLIADSPLLVAVVAFVWAAVLLRYWRYHLPGGRELFPLPRAVPAAADPGTLRALEPLAETVARMGRRRAAARILARLETAEREALAAALDRARAVLATGDVAAARSEGERLARQMVPSEAARRGAAVDQAVSLGLTVAVPLAAALVLRFTVAETFRVESSSMLPTLLPFDRVIASKSAYGWQLPLLGRTASKTPRRGDLIVFRGPAERGPAAGAQPGELVKRVVGLPGDVITMQNGHVRINGWDVPACDAGVYVHPGRDGGAVGRLLVEFLEDRAYLTVHVGTFFHFPHRYLVKPGEVFVLGDNRNQSIDSRAWGGGRGAGIPVSAVDGRLTHVIGGDRNGDLDRSRLFVRPGLEPAMPGVDVAELRAGIARCLAQRPAATPPAPPR